MTLNWQDFKSVITGRNVPVQYCQVGENYWLKAFDGRFEVECLLPKDETNADTADFVANFLPEANKRQRSNVETQFERTDLVLKCCRETATFDETGRAEISIQVPGTPGSTDGRFVAGGYAMTDSFTFGDHVAAISIVDVDNIMGYGAETVIQTYHDEDVAPSAQGWFMWPQPQAGGEVDIEPIGFYGFIPSGLYLEIYFQRAPSGTAQNVYCDVVWARHHDP